ncbi:hypothetical protein [Synoicihabitans lomoniglobus]|uniref:Glyoxalase n=1 Tax=Synoicihabitans lomoniglobus TaxID=2909285 RepID=A0AAE9ZVH5_9BACT|nr:hypothetical protein [Opitutaceae bacterium LMO-M01]WED64842.1 hypothetical protein PXH66_21055 [Opitutaceae bacterium LMO-M01]
MITHLDHIQLAMPPEQEDRARTFFVGLLGMTEETKPEPLAARGGCWFRSGPTIVHVGVESNFGPQGKAHPAFCVSDLATLAERLRTASLPVQPDTALPDRRRIYTTDPFGNRLEFIQDGDGFGQK